MRVFDMGGVDVSGLMGVEIRAAMPVVAPRGLTGVGEVRPSTVRGLNGAEICAGESLEVLWLAKVLD
jgi:hypothetical protein